MTWSDSNKLCLPAAGHWHPLVKGRERGLGGMLGGGPFIWAVLDVCHLLRIILPGFASAIIATPGQLPWPIWLSEPVTMMSTYRAHCSVSSGWALGFWRRWSWLCPTLSPCYSLPLLLLRTSHSLIRLTLPCFQSIFTVFLSRARSAAMNETARCPAPHHVRETGDSHAKERPQVDR